MYFKTKNQAHFNLIGDIFNNNKNIVKFNNISIVDFDLIISVIDSRVRYL